MARRTKKGWGRKAPKLTSERRAIYARCGEKCFLRPSDLGYPICPKRSRSCKPTCQGLQAAYKRARQQHSHGIAKKAKTRAKRMKCAWVG